MEPYDICDENGFTYRVFVSKQEADQLDLDHLRRYRLLSRLRKAKSLPQDRWTDSVSVVVEPESDQSDSWRPGRPVLPSKVLPIQPSNEPKPGNSANGKALEASLQPSHEPKPGNSANGKASEASSCGKVRCASGKLGACWAKLPEVDPAHELLTLCRPLRTALRPRFPAPSVWLGLSDSMWGNKHKLDYSGEQIKEKIRNLKRKFSECKRGVEPSESWEYFTAMSFIYDSPLPPEGFDESPCEVENAREASFEFFENLDELHITENFDPHFNSTEINVQCGSAKHEDNLDRDLPIDEGIDALTLPGLNLLPASGSQLSKSLDMAHIPQSVNFDKGSSGWELLADVQVVAEDQVIDKCEEAITVTGNPQSDTVLASASRTQPFTVPSLSKVGEQTLLSDLGLLHESAIPWSSPRKRLTYGGQNKTLPLPDVNALYASGPLLSKSLDMALIPQSVNFDKGRQLLSLLCSDMQEVAEDHAIVNSEEASDFGFVQGFENLRSPPKKKPTYVVSRHVSGKVNSPKRKSAVKNKTLWTPESTSELVAACLHRKDLIQQDTVPVRVWKDVAEDLAQFSIGWDECRSKYNKMKEFFCGTLIKVKGYFGAVKWKHYDSFCQLHDIPCDFEPPPVKEIQTNKGNRIWTDEAVQLLIAEFEERKYLFESTKSGVRHSLLYDEIASVLNQFEIGVVGSQCQGQMSVLKQKFREEYDTCKKTGGAPSEWPFYELMLNLFGVNASLEAPFAVSVGRGLTYTMQGKPIDDNRQCRGKFKLNSSKSTKGSKSAVQPKVPIYKKPFTDFQERQLNQRDDIVEEIRRMGERQERIADRKCSLVEKLVEAIIAQKEK